MAIDYAAVEAAYYENASYDEDASVAKAKAFRTACRRLIARPQSASTGNESFSLSPSEIRQQLEAVSAWLAVNDAATTSVTPGAVRHPDFTNFRN